MDIKRSSHFIDHILYSYQGMIVYQPGSGIPHNLSDFLPHQGPVAMNAAFRTCGFGIPESALVKFYMGIIDKFSAFIAKGCPGMVFAAIKCDHLFYSYFFRVYSIVFIMFHTKDNKLQPSPNSIRESCRLPYIKPGMPA